MTYAISANGLALIREYEGFRAEPAQLPDGNWVVGHGHVRIGEAGPAVTENEAGDLLALDLAPVERLVNAAVTARLTQSQFDALVSFAFSIGHEQFERSQVARRVNTGDFVSAACAMDAWRKSDVSGELEIVDALVRRRAAEKALFLKDLPHDAAPSVFMRAKLDYAASVLGAPLKYAAAPAVGSIPVVQMKQQDSVVLTEVLRSEPATETLLLTQPIANDVDDADMIHTAHAKPVARTMDDIRAATRLAYETRQPANDRRPRFTLFHGKAEQPKLEIDRRLRSMRKRAHAGFRLPSFDFGGSFENAGLYALLAFGLALVALGGSLLFSGSMDAIEIGAGAAVMTPGVLATLLAVVGLRRPQMRPA